jgi:hypothetical protein
VSLLPLLALLPPLLLLPTLLLVLQQLLHPFMLSLSALSPATPRAVLDTVAVVVVVLVVVVIVGTWRRSRLPPKMGARAWLIIHRETSECGSARGGGAGGAGV